MGKSDCSVPTFCKGTCGGEGQLGGSTTSTWTARMTYVEITFGRHRKGECVTIDEAVAVDEFDNQSTLITQSDLDETERVRFDDQGFESCLLNHANHPSSFSEPRLRYRILCRVALCYPAITHRPRGVQASSTHSCCRFALPSSPSFGPLPSLGGSAGDLLMITDHLPPMTFWWRRIIDRRVRGRCSYCLALSNVALDW